MKSLPALLTIALLSVGVTACGSASKGMSSTSTTSSSAATTSPSPTKTTTSAASTQVYTKADADKDNDISAPDDDASNRYALSYGHAASAADQRAVTELVKRYYAAALKGDGAKACAMIVSSLSKAVVEDYGHGSPGPSYLQSGKTCPQVMALLFKHFHAQLTAEIPKLEVARVRLVGPHGFAIMSFGAMPEREISVRREGSAWKVQALLDSELP
jgi:hypothetical protein